MRAKDRTPTTRLLALAAFLLAAGLLSLRTYETFNAADNKQVGGPAERELTYLLEPITGRDRVRVTISGQTPKTVLVMVDGQLQDDLSLLEGRIETVLVSAIGFNSEIDTFTVTQFPFAEGAGPALTPVQISELVGLGLLTLIVFGALIAPTRSPQTRQPQTNVREQQTSPVRPTRAKAAIIEPDESFEQATVLAESKPNQTANLVRGWMSYQED